MASASVWNGLFVKSPSKNMLVAGIALAIVPLGSALAGDKHWTLDSTTDVASQGSRYIDTSVTMSPFGSLYESGARLRVTASYNTYSLKDPVRTASNRSVDFLMGYTHLFERYSISVGAGPTAANVRENTIPSLDQTQVGGKAFVSSYGRPTDNTMLYGQLSYSSATQFRLAQTKLGWKIAQNVYAGPEMSVTGGRGFNQARVGGHVTGFALGGISSGLSVGVVQDSSKGSGLYSSITLQADL